MTVSWQIWAIRREGRPWHLLAQGPDLRNVMALLTKARLSMPRRTAFTVVRTETLEGTS
jgi:hypothetical protein